MATTLSAPRTSHLPADWSLADIQQHVGGIPAERIRSFPPPGFAVVEDVQEIYAKEKRLCELIDGILVQKTSGFRDALISTQIGVELVMFVSRENLGKVLSASGMLQILPNQVRIPDACFIGWSRFPDGRLPKSDPIPPLVPDLVVEVLSQENTPREMERKREEYFQAGVRLIWYVDPSTRSTTVYTSGDDPGTVHAEAEPLSGDEVLPGFTLSLADIFQQSDRDPRRP